MQSYRNYEKLQDIREAIDTNKNAIAAQLKFRGRGAPNNGNPLYGSISKTELANETIGFMN